MTCSWSNTDKKAEFYGLQCCSAGLHSSKCLKTHCGSIGYCGAGRKPCTSLLSVQGQHMLEQVSSTLASGRVGGTGDREGYNGAGRGWIGRRNYHWILSPFPALIPDMRLLGLVLTIWLAQGLTGPRASAVAYPGARSPMTPYRGRDLQPPLFPGEVQWRLFWCCCITVWEVRIGQPVHRCPGGLIAPHWNHFPTAAELEAQVGVFRQS